MSAVIVTGVIAATTFVCTVKLADVAPAAMVTDAGTVANAELLLSVITLPPAGAGLDRYTLPVKLVPLLALMYASQSRVRSGGLI